MEKLKGITQLKSLLDYVPRLKRLASNPRNQEFPAWDKEVKHVIEETFGRDSKEFLRYEGPFILKRVGTREEKEQAYIDSISQCESAIRDIIQDNEFPEKTELQIYDIRKTKDELEQFHDNFLRYKELVIGKRQGSLTSEQDSEFEILIKEMQRKLGSLKQVIEKYGGSSIVLLQGGSYECEAFSSSFNYTLFAPDAIIVLVDAAVATLNMAIGNLEALIQSRQFSKEAVFTDGKQYDAYTVIKDIIKAATKNILVADSYVDSTLFTLFENAQPNVQIRVLTKSMQGDFKLAGKKFKEQYESTNKGTLEIRKSSKLHDRFIVADGTIFHLGPSIKDAGDKMFAMSEFEDPEIKGALIEMINNYWDKADIVL